MIRLVACDLDGTIINAQGECDPSVVETIQYLHEKGIQFAICSGRPYASVRPLLVTWGMEGLVDYIIGNNGGEAVSMHTGERVENYLLPPEEIKEIITKYSHLGIIPTMYEGNMFYAQELTPTVLNVGRRVNQRVEQANIVDIVVKPQFKEMFVVEPEEMARIEAYVSEHSDPRWFGMKTARDLFEFCDVRLGKDTGLKAVAEMMNIDADNIMVFGDTTNDIAMLKYAKHAICMANGTDDAKAVATAIADSVDEQGFAKYIRQHIV